jgi:hypothetical protein
MSKDFAHRFVDLSRSGFAAETIAKLGLDHREG